MGLVFVGVDLDEKGVIKVDGYFQILVLNIYVVGDVIDWVVFILVVICEGVVFVEMVFNDNLIVVDYLGILMVVFSQLEIGIVGFMEVEVLEKVLIVYIYKSIF